jgi:uncharacterized protein with PIN domain
VIYIDTSCLLKIFREEPHSVAVKAAVMAESEVIVSSLTEIEALVQLKGIWAGGGIDAIAQSGAIQISTGARECVSHRSAPASECG